jgi:hypothetical protein
MIPILVCAAYVLIGVGIWIASTRGPEGPYGHGEDCAQCAVAREHYPVLERLLPALLIVGFWMVLLPGALALSWRSVARAPHEPPTPREPHL